MNRLAVFFIVWLACFVAVGMLNFPAWAENKAAAGDPAVNDDVIDDFNEDRRSEGRDKRVHADLDLDLYYTSAGMIVSLTGRPIPQSKETNEFFIYRDLLKRSLLPRFLLFEASTYPMPCLGTFLKKNARHFYDDSEIIKGFNLIKAVTAGFEEPYAFSFFAGNVVAFKSPQDGTDDWNHGYMGYLFSCGDYHIKDNTLIYDKWYELEWKLKGDLIYSDQKLSWSFRTGVKMHGHPDINDSIYVSLRRSLLDFAAPSASIWRNSGFEYTYHATSRGLKPISHEFSVEKKWPLSGRKFGFSLVAGFVWEADRKYTGSLSRKNGEEFQVLVRPNLAF